MMIRRLALLLCLLAGFSLSACTCRHAAHATGGRPAGAGGYHAHDKYKEEKDEDKDKGKDRDKHKNDEHHGEHGEHEEGHGR